MREPAAMVAALLRGCPMCLGWVTQQGAVSREAVDAALAARAAMAIEAR